MRADERADSEDEPTVSGSTAATATGAAINNAANTNRCLMPIISPTGRSSRCLQSELRAMPAVTMSRALHAQPYHPRIGEGITEPLSLGIWRSQRSRATATMFSPGRQENSFAEPNAAVARTSICKADHAHAEQKLPML
jgi:hypothetical protein